MRTPICYSICATPCHKFFFFSFFFFHFIIAEVEESIIFFSVFFFLNNQYQLSRKLAIKQYDYIGKLKQNARNWTARKLTLNVHKMMLRRYVYT